MLDKYDDNGMLIYFKDIDGDEHWAEYDNNGEYTYLASTWKDNDKYKDSRIIYKDIRKAG